MLGRKRHYSERPRRFELDQRGFAWMQTGFAQCADSDQGNTSKAVCSRRRQVQHKQPFLHTENGMLQHAA